LLPWRLPNFSCSTSNGLFDQLCKAREVLQ
jgi:hypothetical protein